MLILSCLCGCSDTRTDGGVDIVCTVFPIYDWVRNIVGEQEGISITLLVKNGTDPHSYSPTPSDIAKISSCDLLVYVGGESDSWVTDVLGGSVNEEMKVVKLLETLGDRAFVEKEIEGASCGDDCGEHGHEHDHTHEDGAYDEHIWLSLKNAEFLCGELETSLSRLVPDRADAFSEKANAYKDKLKALDSSYEETAASSESKVLLFADRFPFRYLTEDYGIEYFAAFSGCSADVEASFETVTYLAKKIDELSLKYVVILESSDTALADTVISSSTEKNAEIIVMDSMQSITSSDIENGVSYLSVMEKNLAVVTTAFGK